MALDDLDISQFNKWADQTYDIVEKFGSDHGVPAWLTNSLALVLSGFPLLAGLVSYLLIALVVKVGSLFAVAVLSVIGKARTENASDFNPVIAAAMSEFLGVELSADDIPTGTGAAGNLARVRVIGDKLHDLLTSEFGGLRPLQPEDGANNARTFSGYAINFAVSSAFIGILTEALTVGQLKEFRELGVECAQSLGLGRLQRLALQPLIRNMIQQPYDLYLRSQLRPDRLSEATLVKALRAGVLSDDAVRAQLAEKGYRDEDIEILITDLTARLGASTLARLIRYNQIQQPDAVASLQKDGTAQEDATRLLLAQDEERADSQVGSILSDLETARLEGFIDQVSFDGFVDDLPLSDEEDRLYRKRVADQLERPRKKLTFAQVKAGVKAGILDFDYLDTFLTNEGYSDADSLYLTYEVLVELDATATKEQAQAKRKK